MFTAVLSSQMELAVLALMLVLLYSFRYVIGTAPTYVATGVYFIFALLVGSTRLAPTTEAANALSLDCGILWLPFVLLLLIIYELEGNGAAQRLYLSLVVSTLLFLLLFLFLFLQPPSAAQSATAEFFAAARSMASSTDARTELLHGIGTRLFLFLLVPMLYQAILNQGNGRRYGLAIFMALALYSTLVEAMGAIYVFFTAGPKAYLPTSPAGWLLRLGSALLLALLGHFFIVINTPYRKRSRKPLKFLTGFVDFVLSPERMTRSLSEWSERYRVVVENSSELILLATPDGKVLNANRIAVKYLGSILDQDDFKLEQVLFDEQLQPWSWKTLLPESAHDIHEAASTRHVYNCRNLFLRVPGRKSVDIDLNISPAQLDGQPIAVIIGRDMTEQRDGERQRKTRQEQMLHSQRLESLGELAGGIAHDFNNLLQSIQCSADALQRKCSEECPDSGHLIGNIEEGCRRATALTSQLLGFARKGKFHADLFDAKDLLEHALQLFQPVAKGIACRVVSEPVPMPLYVDEIQLSQVLLNMLINARDALKDAPEPRKITLRAEIANERMSEWEFRPNREALPTDYICLHVRDNGCGMTDEVRQKIFEPFFTTKPAGHGTGMGLPMAFGCIANHHGWIHVESAPGEGCDITIFLPMAKN